MQKIISVFVTLATFLLALLGISEVQNTGEFNNKNWMSQIDGSAYISEISIPGTHDSCALYEPISPSAKCQEYTIKDQLEMGVRFIDVRAWVIGGETQISHGVVLQSQTLNEIVGTCKEFLEENPTETIIFSLKKENSALFSKDEVADIIEKIVAEDKDGWYVENKIPTLDEVRGKIVLFNRFDEESDLGINAAGDERWLKNVSFTIENESHKIHVQDHYNIGKKENIETMWEEAVALMEESKAEESRSDNLYVNFLSGYTGIIPNIQSVSDIINPNMANYVSNAGKGCYGIIIMDFVDSELCEKIIETNM